MEINERLFLGLHLDPLFKEEITAHAKKLRELYPNQKWVNLRHFHFTIHFLGDSSSEQREKIARIATEIASQAKPFDVALEGMGAFPNLNKPRVVWVGAAKVCLADLHDFYRKITVPLIAEGFPVEHESFTPHATLFRVRADSLIPWSPEVFQFPKTPLRMVNRLTLFKSTLTEWGAEYVPIEEYPFRNESLGFEEDVF
ncbi:MAG TPA: RNA 2',3'-cyclic phosphodiesterase [Candidatus Omnitrophica bacterium]|nr:RNA 2',3'-cyclic phosphodiesterase [Candidatus Omnitrophota bacterium]